jgi:hypothetical protein
MREKRKKEDKESSLPHMLNTLMMNNPTLLLHFAESLIIDYGISILLVLLAFSL